MPVDNGFLLIEITIQILLMEMTREYGIFWELIMWRASYKSENST